MLASSPHLLSYLFFIPSPPSPSFPNVCIGNPVESGNGPRFKTFGGDAICLCTESMLWCPFLSVSIGSEQELWTLSSGLNNQGSIG